MGTALASAVGTAYALVVDVASYAVSVMSLALIRGGAVAGRQPSLGGLLAGLRFILGQPVLRLLVATAVVSELLIRRVGSARMLWLGQLLAFPLFLLLPAARPGWAGVAMAGLGMAMLSATSRPWVITLVTYQQRAMPLASTRPRRLGVS